MDGAGRETLKDGTQALLPTVVWHRFLCFDSGDLLWETTRSTLPQQKEPRLLKVGSLVIFQTLEHPGLLDEWPLPASSTY